MKKNLVWSVNFDITLDGESVRYEDLELEAQDGILSAIRDDYFTGMFDTEVPDPMLDYVKSHFKGWEILRGWDCIENKQPLPKDMQTKIYDLCEEYCDDNDLPEGSWMETYEDEEEVFIAM